MESKKGLSIGWGLIFIILPICGIISALLDRDTNKVRYEDAQISICLGVFVWLSFSLMFYMW